MTKREFSLLPQLHILRLAKFKEMGQCERKQTLQIMGWETWSPNKHMFAWAKSCVLHLCNAVRSTCEASAKTQRLCQEKGAQSYSIRVFTRVRKNTQLFHENTPLFHFFFTFLFWFSTMIFEKNVYTGENLKEYELLPSDSWNISLQFSAATSFLVDGPRPLLHCR